MQRTDETIKLLNSGKVYIKVCSEFNLIPETEILSALFTCGMYNSVKYFDKLSDSQKVLKKP